jgi:hypothetical protein
MITLRNWRSMASFTTPKRQGFSSLLEGAISHDKITRFLSEKDFTSADL